MNEEKVIIDAKYPLAATMSFPEANKQKLPGVLLIQGTGKSDRDGNDKRLKMNLHKELADFLTTVGFVTLRYDKRGTHESGGNYDEMGVYDLIDDAEEAVKFLKNHPRVDEGKVIILGHSEGAMLAPVVHQQSPVAGLVLLAGAAEPSKDLLPRQFAMAMKEIEATRGLKGWLFRVLKVAKKARKQNQALMEKVMTSTKPVMRIRGAKLNAKWLREQMEFNVCDYLTETHCPVLAITGDKDIQVPPDHARIIAEMVPGESEWHVIPDMNHILRKYERDHTMLGLMKEYKRMLDQPLDRELLEKLEKWVVRYSKADAV
ncbi:alpha/beta hydrolase [Lentibacillus sediminis]|uniref:alpha/beta hydrolase n=1 Tax=Lentibacillus sediminis TaxID=1940529 RepID=UPI000C1B9703|nr:alpha/beta hydrolase [Lentibacillus sediminis]